ncbi:5-oxoprolinase subunit PxpB [Paenibacillus ginsengarvi]|uniref:5-oxoprolinase subunit PxpB n=1 Tax=Paenibacillus ginsengarvi TaxID=400777 RepID=A0A3B0C260_9BACL|nr:5-oxoprolinase subunit PxpB [Paenibacillus ginsengarvi]RKN78279.1 5-oxoprolinase subunit PxpB [Paenibacillus ginsengarvi]
MIGAQDRLQEKQPQDVRIVPLGDTAIVVQWGDAITSETHQRVRQLTAFLEDRPFAGLIEYVPAFTTVTVYYDALTLIDKHAGLVAPENRDFPFAIAEALLSDIVNQLVTTSDRPARIVEIPVCYGGEFGPDLEAVAAFAGKSAEEVIAIHTSAYYLVYMLGFAPGFAYLGGMSGQIATPRRETPRLSIPAGSVGIAGGQTGVYPIETPGGWQLIGKTPIPLFLPGQTPPTRLQAGDIVRFRRISRTEYDRWKEPAR